MIVIKDICYVMIGSGVGKQLTKDKQKQVEKEIRDLLFKKQMKANIESF